MVECFDYDMDGLVEEDDLTDLITEIENIK